MPWGQDFTRLTSRARGQAGKAEAMMVTTGSVMTVTGSRMRWPAMLEIAVGDNSPGSHTVLWEQRLSCTVPCPKKKFRALRRHAYFAAAAAGVRGNVFYTTRFPAEMGNLEPISMDFSAALSK